MKMLTVCALLCAMVALTGAYPAILTETATPIPSDEDILHETMTTTPSDEDIWSETMLPIPTEEFGGWKPYCPDGWTMFSTRCLLYVPKPMTWAQAEENCRNGYGNLASVINTEHSDEIEKVMLSAGQKSKQIWVGGYNTPEDSSWSWTDPMINHGFHHWCTEEHKNHCVKITFEENASGCLDDMQCNAKLPSVCSIVIM